MFSRRSAASFLYNRPLSEYLQPLLAFRRKVGPLPQRDIVVIGGSAGSVQSLRTIVSGLPAGFPASIFVLIHLSADTPSMLPDVLSQAGHLPASAPNDNETFKSGHIYVARPDFHLMLESNRIRVVRGPRENRHRPAIDPLFRSAAREHGPRVIGIVVSGLFDDGSAGLYAIKQRGGIAIIQDPQEAAWKAMPQHALEYASPHHVLKTSEIAACVVGLVNSRQGETVMSGKKSNRKKSSGRNRKPSQYARPAAVEEIERNVHVAYPDEGEGTPSVFACPECHGVLWEVKNGKLIGFRCRVGHSHGLESLEKEMSQASEAALWSAMRALEEKAALQRRTAEVGGGSAKMRERLLEQAKADANNAQLVREMIFGRDAELERRKA